MQKAHVVNRRLSAVVHLGYTEWKHGKAAPDVSQLIADNSTSTLDAGELHLAQQKFTLIKPFGEGFLANGLHVAASDQARRFLVLVNKLLSKNMRVFGGCHEIVVIGKV